jgi:hypothetical protein
MWIKGFLKWGAKVVSHYKCFNQLRNFSYINQLRAPYCRLKVWSNSGPNVFLNLIWTLWEPYILQGLDNWWLQVRIAPWRCGTLTLHWRINRPIMSRSSRWEVTQDRSSRWQEHKTKRGSSTAPFLVEAVMAILLFGKYQRTHFSIMTILTTRVKATRSLDK